MQTELEREIARERVRTEKEKSLYLQAASLNLCASRHHIANEVVHLLVLGAAPRQQARPQQRRQPFPHLEVRIRRHLEVAAGGRNRLYCDMCAESKVLAIPRCLDEDGVVAITGAEHERLKRRIQDKDS